MKLKKKTCTHIKLFDYHKHLKRAKHLKKESNINVWVRALRCITLSYRYMHKENTVRTPFHEIQ